jgi:hypothetical protein
MTGYQSKKAAARDKLAQPEQEPVGSTREAFEKWAKTLPNYMDITRFENGYSDCNTDYAWAGWQAALAQPAQEPVAWKHPDKNMVFWKDTKEVDEYHVFKPTIPLYTAPPQEKNT